VLAVPRANRDVRQESSVSDPIPLGSRTPFTPPHPRGPAGFDPWRFGRFRLLDGRRWWRWFAVFAVIACVHDWCFHAPRATASARTEAAATNADGGHEATPPDEEPGGHADPAAPVLLAIVLILLAAKVSGDVFERLSLPAVLGELTVGVLLGNLGLLLGGVGLTDGSNPLQFLMPPPPHETKADPDAPPAHLDELTDAADDETADDPAAADAPPGEDAAPAADDPAAADAPAGDDAAPAAEPGSSETDGSGAATDDAEHEPSAYDTGAILSILASLGVILLLFEVGLESSVKEMLSVGTSALFVAVLGVVAPIALGYGIGMWLLPAELVHADGSAVPFSGALRHAAAAFLGATLCATSVGITARVLKDLGQSQRTESRIILGAAVVDDVLGLIVLAIVSGVITAAGQQSANADSSLAYDVTKIVVLAFAFIAGALLLGAMRFPRLMFKGASHLRGHGLLVATALVICFGFSWLANFMGLATIVGAFAAGLILENAHYRELGHREDHELEEAIAPISGLLVPIFFVQMGLQVRLESFGNPSVWALAAGLTIVAILGKQVCAVGVVEPGLNKLAVGLGMIPRGEVGLIFANVGKQLRFNDEPIIGDATYSAVIVMVMITTMVTPPLLKWSLSRGDRARDAPGGGGGD
jgi:Kef-type K+ transport system membrane component KefB